MLGAGMGATVQEITPHEALDELSRGYTSAVSHEVTASVLSALLGEKVAFARVNLTLTHLDRVVCIIPVFRATEAREFTREEVESAGYRCFLAVALTTMVDKEAFK